MNKEQAIQKIKKIQSGHGSTRHDFPDEMKGRIAKYLWNSCDFSYGFEYGEIHGLMKSFDIKKEDLE